MMYGDDEKYFLHLHPETGQIIHWFHTGYVDEGLVPVMGIRVEVGNEQWDRFLNSYRSSPMQWDHQLGEAVSWPEGAPQPWGFAELWETFTEECLQYSRAVEDRWSSGRWFSGW